MVIADQLFLSEAATMFYKPVMPIGQWGGGGGRGPGGPLYVLHLGDITRVTFIPFVSFAALPKNQTKTKNFGVNLMLQDDGSYFSTCPLLQKNEGFQLLTQVFERIYTAFVSPD